MMPNGELLNTISFISYPLFFSSPSLSYYSNRITSPWTKIAGKAMYTLTIVYKLEVSGMLKD
jgi:hypothetical protein